MTDNQQKDRLASAHYNKQYSNDTYNAFKTSLRRDFETGNLTENQITDLMNLLTDAAHNIVGHSLFQGACQKFAVQIALHTISPNEAIQAAITHLKRFEKPGDTYTEDFEATAKGLILIERLTPHLDETGILSNGHSNCHRAAHYLTYSAGMLIRTAQILLMQGDLFYAAEKASIAKNQMQWGFQELTTGEETGKQAFSPLLPITEQVVSPLTGEQVQMLFQWLKGDADASSDGLVVWYQPHLTEREAWAVIYYLQEEFHILPKHFQYCDKCGAFHSLRRVGCSQE